MCMQLACAILAAISPMPWQYTTGFVNLNLANANKSVVSKLSLLSARPYESCQNISVLVPPRCPLGAGTYLV